MKGNDTGVEQNWINPQNMPLLRVESTQSTTILYIRFTREYLSKLF